MKNFIAGFLLLIALPVAAQQSEIDSLKSDIDLFAGVLEEALDLNQNSGLFGLSLGGVDPVYLRGQGLVIEVRSQLANRRNRLNLASLNSTMQSLRTGENPFDAFRRRTAENATSLDSVLNGGDTETEDSVDSFYQQMMQRVADVDYSLVINTAIQQAGNSIRSLRSLGDMDEEDFQRIRSELDALRDRMTQGVESIRSLQQEARVAASADSALDESTFGARLDELLANFEPLRDEALQKARELQLRMDQAEADYAQRWRADILEFESKLYAALCDFSAPLRNLPENETLALVLQGLGDETNNQATDKVHVVSLTAIRSCQQGVITSQQLQADSISYSY